MLENLKEKRSKWRRKRLQNLQVGGGEQGRVTEKYLGRRCRKSSNHSWWNLPGRKQMGREDPQIQFSILEPRGTHPVLPGPLPHPWVALPKRTLSLTSGGVFRSGWTLQVGSSCALSGLFTLSDPLHKTAPSTANSLPPLHQRSWQKQPFLTP